MTPPLLGAALILASLVAGTWLARWWATPITIGRHRATATRPPVEALVETTARCRVCRRETRHAITRVHGEHICRGCGAINHHVGEAAL
ncbi:hypothetical protein [Streptomyces acidiscabies]|uniref:hypothetical protein n=1 Tax=Streptomyces acidiscabies TaxID=42234 RepID=UPI0009512EE5|nr:hypothetical protein [Streptomyces acidiscabies]